MPLPSIISGFMPRPMWVIRNEFAAPAEREAYAMALELVGQIAGAA